MVSPRSPRLRADRPFQVRHKYWFGNNALNGMVWRIQTRERDGQLYTHNIRDGGPFDDYTSLAEALRWVRDFRRQRRLTERSLKRVKEDPTVIG